MLMRHVGIYKHVLIDSIYIYNCYSEFHHYNKDLINEVSMWRESVIEALMVLEVLAHDQLALVLLHKDETGKSKLVALCRNKNQGRGLTGASLPSPGAQSQSESFHWIQLLTAAEAGVQASSMWALERCTSRPQRCATMNMGR